MSTKYLSTKHGIEISYDSGTIQLIVGDGTPSINGIPASIGSLYLSSSISGTIYKKVGEQDIDWLPDTQWYSYLNLTDTPTSYNGYENMYLRVNESGTGLYFDYMEVDLTDEDSPLIPDTAVSGTYFVNFEAGRLLIGATGNKPDLYYMGPIGGLAFSDKAEEACYGTFKVPYSWNTGSDIKFKINFVNLSAQTGVTYCSWKLDFHSYVENEIYSSKTTSIVDLTTTISSNCPAGTFHSHDLLLPYDDTNNPIARGDIVPFKFYRDGAASTDTLSGDAVILALMIEIQTGQHIVSPS